MSVASEGGPERRGAERYPRAGPGPATLLLNELYLSLQGEGPEQGFPTVLLRLAGCNLRCSYCDSAYAFFEGRRVSLAEAVERTLSFGVKRVLVTGGEPMAQAATPALCRSLLGKGLSVSLETNGAYGLSSIPGRVVKVVDVKTPGSGEAGSFAAEILGQLGKKDVLKFVCTDRGDYLWSREFLGRHGLPGPPSAFFSPAWGRLEPAELAAWILEDKLPVRLQLQLHKVVWGEARGR
jgi:7-carboxy-7-deazaguanine synthase